MAKKEKNAPVRYNILFVPDNGKHVKSIHTSADFLIILLVFLIALFVAAVTFVVHSASSSDKDNARMEELQEQVNTLSDDIIVLQADKETLQNQLREAYVKLETNDTAKKKQDEEQSLKYIPSGMPLDGQVPLPSEYSDEKQYITFKAGTGTKIVAAGDGVVSYVGDSAEYGHIVKVDHGNGYVTVYCDKSDPTVNEKDEVIRGTTLFVMSEDQEVLTYQISYEGEFIDPYTVMDIDG